jgi:PadR family transcriptional regulator
MGRRKQTPGPGELVQGTLDMLILKVLSLQKMHGWGIAQRIRQVSEEVLRVEEGSLYPALRRLELDGFIRAEWGTSENNRRARYYELTRAGRRRLTSERDRWDSLAAAIARVMEMNP